MSLTRNENIVFGPKTRVSVENNDANETGLKNRCLDLHDEKKINLIILCLVDSMILTRSYNIDARLCLSLPCKRHSVPGQNRKKDNYQ